MVDKLLLELTEVSEILFEDGTSSMLNENSAINIVTPVPYFTLQRNSSSEADISITGTYAGTPTAIQARFNNSSWVSIDTNPTGGTFSGTLSDQSAGQGLVEVRFSDYITITDSSEYIGIGDIYIIAGQSNHDGQLDNYQTYSHGSLKAIMYNDGTWQELSDPTGTWSDKGSIWPLLATLHMAATDIPIAFITTAVASSGLVEPADWAVTGSDFINSKNAVIASGVNTVLAMLWLQGENEAIDGTVSQSTYQTALMTMLNNYQTAIGLPIKMGVAQLLKSAQSDRAPLDGIRQAQAYPWDNDSDIFAGPVLHDISGDGLHILSNADALIFAQRWWHFLKLQFFNGTEGRGPRLYTVSKISDTVTLYG